ncbi:hypothetical protein [Acidimangrovimonas pyrenivorans]|uniref:O-antigen ligase like membrane protein n=1 Tax=Acidimangrovimonas pyrenivorans TaxID=2030798 RepID=A0ABV7AC10_9RHOB
MQIVPTTFLALAVIVALAVKGPYRGLWLFLAVTPFGAAAAFNLPAAGGASIIMRDFCALALFVLLWMQKDAPARLLGSMRPFRPGFYLLLLVVFCTVAALFFPRLFVGQTEVFAIARVKNQSSIVSIPLRPTTGNLTQLFRIYIDAAAFFALATVFRQHPDGKVVVKGMAAATFVHVGLGILDVLSHDVGLPQLLDFLRTANYAMLTEVSMAGLKRMVGGFPEASAFGYYTLGLFGFWLHYWLRAGRSALAAWCLLLTAFVLVRSTSSSAYVAAMAFLVAYAGFAVARHLDRRINRRSAALTVGVAVTLWLAFLVLVAAYELVGPVSDFLNRALFDKLGTASGVERMSWNAQAWVNFTETWLMGAGLGSMRASNWLLACLGSIGLIGTALFAGFFASLGRAPAPAQLDPDRAAAIGGLKAGCFALLISAMLTAPTPDLGVFFFALAGLASGLSRGAVIESRRELHRGMRDDW